MMFCLLLLAFLSLGRTQTDFSFQLEETNITTNSISIRYTVNPFEGVVDRANITAVYVDRCSDSVPTRTVILDGFSDSYTISNLEEFSEYDIIVILTLVGVRTGTMRIQRRTFGTVPAPPPNFRQAAASMTSITIAWDPIPCLDVNSQLEQFSITYTLGSFSMTDSVSSSATQYTISGLATGTSYLVTLAASYSVGDGSPLTTTITSPLTATTFSIPGPVNLRTMTNETSILFRWNQEMSGQNNIRLYNLSAIYIGPCPGISSTVTETINVRNNNNRRFSFTFTNLFSDGEYLLTVTAIARGMQTATATITSRTSSRVPIGPPLSLRLIEADVFTFLVAWSPPDCEDRRGEIMDYDLYYGPTSNFNSISRREILRIASTRQNITGLTPDTSYSVQVAANNLEGRGPFTEIMNFRTLEPPPGVTDLRVDIDSVQANSGVLLWSRSPGLSYYLTVEYLGPCSGANVMAQRRLINEGTDTAYMLTGLEPHSQYFVSVWPLQSLSNATVFFQTAPSDPFIREGYVRFRDVNDTSITLDVPPLDCIDQNTDISSLYTIKYGEVERNTTVVNNSFSPGVLTIGSLSPGTNYSFEIIISTVDGRVIVLPTMINATIGSRPASTSRPEVITTPVPAPQLPTFVVIIVAVIIVCIVTALTIILVICCISSCRRRYQKRKREDQNELNRMSRIAMALREAENKRRRPPSETSSVSDHEVHQNRPFSFSSIASRKSAPFSEDMNWMSGMKADTTMERANIDLYKQMKTQDAREEDALIYDERDFEYEPKDANQEQQNVEGENATMELDIKPDDINQEEQNLVEENVRIEEESFEEDELEEHNFMDEIAKLVQQNLGGRDTKQEEQEYTYIDGDTDYEGIDFEELQFQTANL